LIVVVVNLQATLTVAPSEATVAERFVATCTLENSGDEAVVINVAPLASPSLALQIEDRDGEPVLLPPPPVPPTSLPIETLAPRQRRVAEFAGFLPSWTPAGTYRARFRYVAGRVGPPLFQGSLFSDWVEFRLLS
jgi:hypothetical protein